MDGWMVVYMHVLVGCITNLLNLLPSDIDAVSPLFAVVSSRCSVGIRRSPIDCHAVDARAWPIGALADELVYICFCVSLSVRAPVSWLFAR